MNNSMDIVTLGRRAVKAARFLRTASGPEKDGALREIGRRLIADSSEILRANEFDVTKARDAGVAEAIIDRLRFTPERLGAVASGIEVVANLPDPVGEVLEGRTLANGIRLRKVSVPFGVIAAIFENRPNVTVDIACLCLKAGSATILRGGAQALRSNVAIGATIGRALDAVGFPGCAVQLVQVENRTVVDEILAAHEYVDLLIPRGGASLIKMVRENATMPTLTGGIGVCHIYVDSSADPVMAVDIVVNSKTRRFSTCNALDTLVIHEHAVAAVLPMLAASLADKQTQLRCDAASFETVRQGANVAEATAADFGKEWLSPVLSVKTVRSHEEALEFIQTHSSGHSDGIITNDYALAQQFCSDVDSGVIYVNASTQFTDGAQFGMGAEIIDSTQKMHARGPVGLREICTHKWIAEGNGQLRS